MFSLNKLAHCDYNVKGYININDIQVMYSKMLLPNLILTEKLKQNCVPSMIKLACYIV